MSFEKLLKTFGFKGRDQYTLDENPSKDSMVNANEQLKQLLTTEGKTLVLHVFTGHSVKIDGMQGLILNEWAGEDYNYCKVFQAEMNIRALATKFP